MLKLIEKDLEEWFFAPLRELWRNVAIAIVMITRFCFYSMLLFMSICLILRVALIAEEGLYVSVLMAAIGISLPVSAWAIKRLRTTPDSIESKKEEVPSEPKPPMSATRAALSIACVLCPGLFGLAKLSEFLPTKEHSALAALGNIAFLLLVVVLLSLAVYLTRNFSIPKSSPIEHAPLPERGTPMGHKKVND